MPYSWLRQQVNLWKRMRILQASFVQICEVHAHSPFSIFFCTSTSMPSQSRWCTSMIKLASLNLLISTYMTLLRLFTWFRFCRITSLVVGSRWRWWQITEGSIRIMSLANQANTSLLAYKKLMNNFFSRLVSLDLILTLWLGLLGLRLIHHLWL